MNRRLHGLGSQIPRIIRLENDFTDNYEFWSLSYTSDDSEFELKARVAAGDEDAFKIIFDQHRQRLFRYIANLTKSNEVAEELVMDVFLKLWLARDMIKEIEKMDSFLFRIAHNKCIDFLRSAAKNRKVADFIWDRVEMAEGANPDNQMIVKEYEAKLREAIDLMPPKRKQVYKLSREAGLSHNEIAEELSISKNTVSNHILEAQQFIRSYLLKNLDLAVLMTVLTQLYKK